VVGSESHTLSLDFITKECDGKHIRYLARVTPPLSAGEEFSYWRTFVLPNWFPLTRAEIAQLASRPDYPEMFGGRFYGDWCGVSHELDSFTWSFQFPRGFRLLNYRVIVVEHLTKREYNSETARCQGLVTWKPFPDKGDNVLELTVPRPLINFDYYLLYEPRQ
jgi:hypothetical protein